MPELTDIVRVPMLDQDHAASDAPDLVVAHLSHCFPPLRLRATARPCAGTGPPWPAPTRQT
ncbi:MAG: hypothetical protein ACI8ZB_004040 [Desulforhopalus sp.]|jgi:hypothetical protein